MKEKLVREYYQTLTSVVICIILTWGFGSFFLLFNGKTADSNLPDNLILAFPIYISIEEDTFHIADEGLDALAEYNSWLQILDNQGQVIYSYNTDETIPTSYSMFELVNYSLVSGRLEGQTIYLSQKDGYPLIIGCSDDILQKISFNFKVQGYNPLIISLLFLVFTIFFVIVVTGIFYVKRTFVPLSYILDSIHHIATDEVIPESTKTNSVFREVFLQLEHLQQKLAENKRQRDVWIANISHDIKTPLSTIRGYTEVLKEYSLTKEEIENYSTEILSAEGKIEQLLEELTLFQRLSEGNCSVNLQTTNIVELIKNCQKDISAVLEHPENITFLGSYNCVMDCDFSLMTRALENILWNAVLHNGNDVKIKITLSEAMELTISDNGKGIAPEDVPHIFHRYYRGTASQHSKGTGLGLAIAKEIITSHGGTILVSSIVGEGTTFYIIF